MKIAGILNSDNYMEFSLRVARIMKPKTAPFWDSDGCTDCRLDEPSLLPLSDAPSAVLNSKEDFNSRLGCYIVSLYSAQCNCSPIPTVLLLRFMEAWWQSSVRLMATVIRHPSSLTAVVKLM